MACEVIHIGGIIDGDENLDPASGDYVAGQPCEITAAGVKVTSSDAAFHGILKNDKSEDISGGPQAVDTQPNSPAVLQQDTGVVLGPNKVRLTPGRLAAGTLATPFVYPGAGAGWVVGNQVYNNGAGKWDNTGTTARGRVTKAPASATDDMIVWMY